MMYCTRLIQSLWVVCFIACAPAALADGMVVPEEYYPKVEIPNQQTLIHFSGGVERLVIETTFFGEGTNFAWVVPLPSAPEVKAVSESFFIGLQHTFQPKLIHRVHPYYAAVLFMCGLAYLGWRALRQEVSWVADLPLCLVLAVGAGLLGRHLAFGCLAAALGLCMRLFARSPAAFALILLMGTVFAAGLTFIPFSRGLGSGLVQTLGPDNSGDQTETVAGVTVLSTQRAGVFDATTIHGTSPNAVMEWLQRNGYRTPKSAEPAIRDYVRQGWVFVASKVRRELCDAQLAAPHPLAFTFPVAAPIYPTRLTAIDNGRCAMDLYVFGQRRAAARYFDAVRCERVAADRGLQKKSAAPGLKISDPELLALIGDSTVGTKLSGRLSPAQMASDVQIRSNFTWRKGARVFSRSGALTIALNVALPLAALAWLSVGASQGGWKIDNQWISRWRWRSLAAAIGLGLAVFLLLPKVEVVTVSHPPARILSDE